MTSERKAELERLCRYELDPTMLSMHDGARLVGLREALAEIDRLNSMLTHRLNAAELRAQEAEAEVSRLTARWEALKAWLTGAVDDPARVKAEIARLEREP